MKKIYCVFLFLSSICYSQNEALLGQWSLDSIFDTDIYLIDPINPITTEFSNDTNGITIGSFCGATYQSLYTTSTTENTITITQANWSPVNCSDDNQGWEFAINALFNLENGNQKDLTYIVTENDTSTSLELSYTYLWEGITTDVTGYFTKQNAPPIEIIGEWFLDHIIKDGVTHNNYFNDNQIFNIEFTNTESFDDFLEFNMGHGCSASNGLYSLNSNEINIEIEGTLAIDCLSTPYAQYETLFLDELTYYIFDENNPTTAAIHTFTITGNGNDQVLTLINTTNGSNLVFTKQAPTTLLISTWWLHQIDIPGKPIINIPNTDFPNLILTNGIDPILNLPQAEGVGECEGFYSNYNVTFNGANNISFSDFNQTLAGCATNTYEGIYFQILSDNTSNFFEFEIVENGSTLVLIDLLGAKLIFGDSTLSIDEQSINNLNIGLKQNPVDDQIQLEINDIILKRDIEYKIYSIDGKIFQSSILNQDTINVRDMESGIYVVSFVKNNLEVSNIKFVKN